MLRDIITRTKNNKFTFKRICNHLDFEMGSDISEIEHYVIKEGEKAKYLMRETPKHEVKLAPFFLQKTPITIEQYREFLKSTDYISIVDSRGNGSVWDSQRWIEIKGVSWSDELSIPIKKASNLAPARRVFYEDAKCFCEWMNQFLPNDLKSKGYVSRLPTEAEWELSASIDQNSKDPKKKKYSWIDFEKSIKQVRNLKTLPPVNELPIEINGFRGLCGINWQWCEDYYQEHFYQESSVLNPLCKHYAPFRVIRGGNYFFPERSWRTTYRSCPSGNYSSYGFRLALAKKI